MKKFWGLTASYATISGWLCPPEQHFHKTLLAEATVIGMADEWTRMGKCELLVLGLCDSKSIDLSDITKES